MQTTEEMITMQEDGLVITAASELVDTYTNASGKEFVWGYYFCIENTSDFTGCQLKHKLMVNKYNS